MYKMYNIIALSLPSFISVYLPYNLLRHWMVTDDNYHYLNGKAEPRLTMIEVKVDGCSLTLSAPGTQPLALDSKNIVSTNREINAL